MLDLEEYIDRDPAMHILKEDLDLFYTPMVSLCGYMTAWQSKEHYLEFHNDIVYIYGEDVEIHDEDAQ